MYHNQIDPIATDTIEGIAAIAAFLGKTERQTIWLLAKGQIPAFKLGGKWHLRRSTYRAFLTQLEARALA